MTLPDDRDWEPNTFGCQELDELIQKFPEYEAAIVRLNAQLSLLHTLTDRLNLSLRELNSKISELTSQNEYAKIPWTTTKHTTFKDVGGDKI